MYDRYMPPHHTFRPIPPEKEGHTPPPHTSHQQRESQPKPPDSDLLSGLTGGIRDFLGGIFDGFSLNKLDSGDILLVLIILFLFLEGDNLDLVIALGLMLLLGLGEKEVESAP